MAGSLDGNVLVSFQILLLALTNVPTGNSSNLLKSGTGERNTTTDVAKYITWEVNGNGTGIGGIGFNVRDSTELVKVNDTAEWPSRNETVTEKITEVGNKVKDFFSNMASGLLGGSRQKRSTGEPEKLYPGRKLWRGHIGEMYTYGNIGGRGNESENVVTPRPKHEAWYNWGGRIGSEKVSAQKKGRYAPSNYEMHPPPLLPPVKPLGYDTFSQPPKPSPRVRNRHLPRVQLTYNPNMHSVKIFKEMSSKLGKKRTKQEMEDHAEMGQSDVPETMRIYAGSQNHPGQQSKYNCKAGTKGVKAYREGRTMMSRGLTFSEEDSRGIRTLLCKAETSDVSEPDRGVFIKNSVTGINVITNDHDPFKFIERGNEIDSEALEIGSQSGSELSYSSVKNQSTSSVSTQGRGAHSQTKVNTKFVYENGYRTAFESASEVDGSTTFNSTEAELPLTLTSRKEESSSILQNPERIGMESVENDDVSTYMSYKKQIDFDIGFRNLFD